MNDTHNTPSRGVYITLLSSLGAYAAFEMISAPFAWLSSREWARVVATMAFSDHELFPTSATEAAERTYGDLAGTFYLLRAVADVGLVVGFIVGLVWLHQAWSRAPRRNKAMSAGAVVGWSLVPIWGYLKLHGFLLDLSRRNGLSEDVVKVGRWWWMLAAHVILRVIAASIHHPGWVHIADSCLAAATALAGMKMVSLFQRAYGERSQAAAVPQPA
jgi:hypothetical protein